MIQLGKPITASMMVHILKEYSENGSFITKHCLHLALLGFTGFLRTDELLHLKVRDIAFNDTYMQFNIRRSKTEQIQHGAQVSIAKL